MKQNLLIRLCVLALALCVCMGPAAALAENVDWSDDDIEYRLLAPIIGGTEGIPYEDWKKVCALEGITSYNLCGEIDTQDGQLILQYDNWVNESQSAGAGIYLPDWYMQENGLEQGAELTLSLSGGVNCTLPIAGSWAADQGEPGRRYAYISEQTYTDLREQGAEDDCMLYAVLLESVEAVEPFNEMVARTLPEREISFISMAEYAGYSATQADDYGYDGKVVLDGTNLDGTEASDLILAGGVTMINVWATFCGPCIEEMPDLGKLAAEYEQSGAAFKIVGVVGDCQDAEGNAVESQVSLAQDIVEATSANYQHVLPGAQARAGVLSTLYAYPTTLFVDGEGNLLGTYVGSRSYEDWKEIIDSLI